MIRATRGRSMDGEDLIICVAIWTLYKLWVPLTSNELRMNRGMISIASRNKLRLTSLFKAIWEAFGGQNKRQNRGLRRLFAMFFSNAFWHRFLFEFWRLETWKIAILLRKNKDFSKIDVFEKHAKKPRFRLRFRRPKRRKINAKPFPNMQCFSIASFGGFLLKFDPFGRPKID